MTNVFLRLGASTKKRHSRLRKGSVLLAIAAEIGWLAAAAVPGGNRHTCPLLDVANRQWRQPQLIKPAFNFKACQELVQCVQWRQRETTDGTDALALAPNTC
jgi:hypothetical protein